eukprot:TRINITY_DN10164_c0_g1_i2.p1 TRINITY_DN10164_c0_g1~~TRINITY_DN10164_c0_g1_i2.p1  ORF type:complete len:277 (-),score=53.20 TRINITY_DN10164_c0_g1_i2:523-1353(-)
MDNSTAATAPGTGVAAGSPLEQFVILAKNAKGAAAVELIKQVLEASGVYVFGELLDMPNIKELEGNPASAPYFHLLQLFAFGTYKEFINKEVGKLAELSPLMLRKLRMLSVVSLAETEKLIPYSTLQAELGLETVREVEDLIIEGISSGIMNGKLDQKNSRFEVDFVIGRDIKQSDFPGIMGVLNSWCATCDSMLSSIESQVEKLNEDKAIKTQQKADLESKIAELKQTVKLSSGGDTEDPDSRMDAERSDRRDKKGKGKTGRGVAVGSKSGFWPK